MHRVALLCVLAVALPSRAEDGPGVRIWKGELIEWNVRGPVGDLAMLDKATIRRCKVSSQTYMTRETLRVTPVGVRVGDFVEVVADLREAGRCTALTLYIKPGEQTPKQRSLSPYWTPRSSPGILDNLFPRGMITLTGIVDKIVEEEITLWTRTQRKVTFALRPDTVFSDNGRPVGMESLPKQTRVFLRAGRTFDGALEAYQVVWGEILFPVRGQ